MPGGPGDKDNTMKKPTAEQSAAAATRRANFKALIKKVADMPETERLALTSGLIVNVQGRQLSPKNMCFVALQLPGATVVTGFRQWLAAGRAVRKGEHGAMIWVPCFGKSEGAPMPAPEGESAPSSEGDERRFIIGTVFDISQTDPLPAGKEAQETPCNA